MPLVRSDRLRPCGVSNDEQAPPRVYSYRTTLILCRGSATEPLTRGEGARTSRRKHGRYLLFQVFLLLGSRGDMIPLAKAYAADDKEKEKQEKEDTTGEGKP